MDNVTEKIENVLNNVAKEELMRLGHVNYCRGYKELILNHIDIRKLAKKITKELDA